GEAITSDGDRVLRLRRAGGARSLREGGMDDSTIPPSWRPFTHSPSPSRPQPVPSSSAPPKICPSLSLPDNALDCFPFGDLLALAVGTSTGLILVYSICRELIRKPQANADSYKITFLRSSVWSCLGLLSFLMARISFLVLKSKTRCFYILIDFLMQTTSLLF
ncbi:unnamed protein product, partial [Musa acuminata var. zebrina]